MGSPTSKLGLASDGESVASESGESAETKASRKLGAFVVCGG